VLMLPPFYYKDVSEEGLYRYFSEVVQRVGDARLRIYLYHIPPVAVVGITTGLVERLLADYPNSIAGMKDSSGDWNKTKTFLDAFASASPARTGFDVFVGSESFLLANMRNGGVGTISATANVNPAAIHSVFAEATTRQEAGSASGLRRTRGKSKGGKLPSSLKSQGDEPAGLDLESLQARLNVVREVFSSRKFPSMIAALKQAIAIYRNDPGWTRVRPPLVELTPEQANTLAAELKAISFEMPGLGLGARSGEK
jgi:4-hydroxy-tetrahydrodipicolinate synthase